MLRTLSATRTVRTDATLLHLDVAGGLQRCITTRISSSPEGVVHPFATLCNVRKSFVILLRSAVGCGSSEGFFAHKRRSAKRSRVRSTIAEPRFQIPEARSWPRHFSAPPRLSAKFLFMAARDRAISPGIPLTAKPREVVALARQGAPRRSKRLGCRQSMKPGESPIRNGRCSSTAAS